MQQDLRAAPLFREAERLTSKVHQPGSGQISDATELHVAPDGRRVVFAGSLVDKLEGVPATRICEMELMSAELRVLTFGPNTDRLPRYSPEGSQVALLSDRHRAGDFQLYLLDPVSSATRPTPKVEGWVESLQWSPDGKQILLGVAGHGADRSGIEGAIASQDGDTHAPPWMPRVDAGNESFHWRHAWIYDLRDDSVRQVSHPGTNIWEAAWCGNTAIAAVTSPGPGEGQWYSARLTLIETLTGHSKELYTPSDQLGWPSASPSGEHLAVVEAICSDRWIVAGNLLLIEPASGRLERVDTAGVDVSYTEWRSDERLLLAGHRGFDSVVGVYDLRSGTFNEVWSSRDVSTGGAFITVSGMGSSGDCALVGEGFARAPEIATIRAGTYAALRSFDLTRDPHHSGIAAIDCVNWQAPDGLDIEGWVLRPQGSGPHPLVMVVHGGPVFHVHPFWMGRGSPALVMLLRRGYAIFFPNPRGSTGRGQEFARKVRGDMGGADTRDCLSGLDYLIERGIADPHRLGVAGRSYGGFMSAWLITQDSRFAAAVLTSPVTNQVSLRLIANCADFVDLFLDDTYNNPNGKYFQRSPVMHAHKVKTPTLSICGALDRCTPPEEAVQFHNALRESQVDSVLALYPQEGHGVRAWPAVFDCAARIVAWFEAHMPSVRGPSGGAEGASPTTATGIS